MYTQFDHEFHNPNAFAPCVTCGEPLEAHAMNASVTSEEPRRPKWFARLEDKDYTNA